MPVNRVGGAFCAPSKSLWETCFPFSTGTGVPSMFDSLEVKVLPRSGGIKG